MVQIAVRADLDSRRWHLIDLQGSVESYLTDLSGMPLGDLTTKEDVRARATRPRPCAGARLTPHALASPPPPRTHTNPTHHRDRRFW